MLKTMIVVYQKRKLGVNRMRELRKLIYGGQSSNGKAIFLDRDGTLNEIVVNINTGQLDSPLSK